MIDRFLAALLPWLHRSFACVGQALRARPQSGAPNAPLAHSLHAERETAFEGDLIAAEKERECRSGGEASCLDRITYRELMR